MPQPLAKKFTAPAIVIDFKPFKWGFFVYRCFVENGIKCNYFKPADNMMRLVIENNCIKEVIYHLDRIQQDTDGKVIDNETAWKHDTYKYKVYD